MNPTATLEREVVPAQSEQPALSHSRIQKYLTCPEQYRLHYVERLRPKTESANLVFGALLHLALAEFFRSKADPVPVFSREWGALQNVVLRYSGRDTWESLGGKGERLLQKFILEEAPKLGRILGIEQRFELRVSSLDQSFIGFIDVLAEIEEAKAIVDFKTSSASYDEYEVALSDQLTAYWMAEPDVQHVGLCVLVKTKEPKIEWHWAERNADHLADYLRKVGIVAAAIADGIFYRRPGKHCGYCDFLPVCLGDRKAVEETLIQIG
jgi:CRISPR/Cas system-associated exonuclease Cas4 (RecB family)